MQMVCICPWQIVWPELGSSDHKPTQSRVKLRTRLDSRVCQTSSNPITCKTQNNIQIEKETKHHRPANGYNGWFGALRHQKARNTIDCGMIQLGCLRVGKLLREYQTTKALL